MEQHPAYTQVLNHWLSLATLVGTAIVTLLVIIYTYSCLKKKHNTATRLVSKYIHPLGFAVSLVGVSLSLFYSEVLHFAPCDLCWFQRIFLYPQLFLFGLAWYRKDRGILPYSLLLSLIGFVVSVYHHLLQMGYDLMKPCSSAPFAVDCSKPSFIEFGFVSFPFMAIVLFGLISVLVSIAIKGEKDRK